jgi:serine/threonine-protein kinase
MKSCPGCGLLYPDESTFCFLDGQTLRAYEDELIGISIDGLFRVQELLGQSGWSRVYRGRLRLVAQPCVLKVIELANGDATARDGFTEAMALARRCSHGNIAPLLGGRIVGTNGVVVRPMLEAQPLSLLLERARLDASQAAGLTLQLLTALGRIHDFGVVHGNLRPNNALYWPNGHVDLIDVAVGRALVRDPWEDSPAALMAQHYLAPELNSKQKSSLEADLFAAGVMAFEMLTARRPFAGNDVRQLRAQLTDEHPADIAGMLAAVPPPLARWTLTMLSRIPQQRPDNAHHARELLVEACREAGVAPMVDPGRPEVAPVRQLDPALARWERYQRIFAKMLEIGFPSGAPEHTRGAYSAIAGRVERLAEIGKRAVFEIGNLDDTRARAREGRENIAGQIDELTTSAQHIRRELDPLKARAQDHADEAAQFAPQMVAKHRATVQWEGRCGFTEPYQELSAAYRDLAELIDRWWEVRQAQLGCERDAEAQRERLRELDGQVEELRAALCVHESNIAGEVDACESTLAELGKEADRIELELLDLASRFSAPLRSKPELGPAFRELTQA